MPRQIAKNDKKKNSKPKTPKISSPKTMKKTKSQKIETPVQDVITSTSSKDVMMQKLEELLSDKKVEWIGFMILMNEPVNGKSISVRCYCRPKSNWMGFDKEDSFVPNSWTELELCSPSARDYWPTSGGGGYNFDVGDDFSSKGIMEMTVDNKEGKVIMIYYENFKNSRKTTDFRPSNLFCVDKDEDLWTFVLGGQNDENAPNYLSSLKNKI